MRHESSRHARDPEGLGVGRPRYVTLTGGGRALLVLAIALLAAAPTAAILIASVAGRQVAEQRSLDEGHDAEGRVTRLWRTRGDKPKHRVAYEFTVDGRTYAKQWTVSARTWGGLAVGSPLEIRYAPSDPRLNHPRGWDRKRPLPIWVATLVAAALVAVGAVVTLPIRSQRRLLEQGRAASATVTSHSKTQHGTIVRYEFRLLSGATRTGKTGPTKKLPPIGGSISVLYDPENPEHNAVYPFSLVEVRR